jgi:hypothetical protein
MKFTWYSYSYVYFLILHHLTSATIRAVHGFENQEAEESAENGVELFFVSEDDNETKQGSGTGDLADSSSTRSADNGKMKMTPHHRGMHQIFMILIFYILSLIQLVCCFAVLLLLCWSGRNSYLK